MRDRTTGTHPGHEIIDDVTGLLPNFGTRGLVMHLRIGGIVELIGQKIIRVLLLRYQLFGILL